jgi:hypothetical protein
MPKVSAGRFVLLSDVLGMQNIKWRRQVLVGQMLKLDWN